MVHDGSDVPAGPVSLDSVTVRFDEPRLVSDAGLLLTATWRTVSGSRIWRTSRCGSGTGCRARPPGSQGDVAGARDARGADSIDDMNVLRAGSTGLILGHRVMAPSTLGTFLRAFTFGHVRQLDLVLDRTLTGRGMPAQGQASGRW